MATSDGCINKIELSFFEKPANFSSAQLECVDIGGNLVTIDSNETFDRVLTLVDNPELDIWIGLEDKEDIGGIDPLRFFFVDGNLDQSFYQDRAVFPWREDRPNDRNSNQNCITIKSGILLFDDDDCTLDEFFVCQSACENEEENNANDNQILTLVGIGGGVCVCILLVVLLIGGYQRHRRNEQENLVRILTAPRPANHGISGVPPPQVSNNLTRRPMYQVSGVISNDFESTVIPRDADEYHHY